MDNLSDLHTIFPYRLATAFGDQSGVALIVIPESTPAFALPVDMQQIQILRGLLNDLEDFLKTRSGNA